MTQHISSEERAIARAHSASEYMRAQCCGEMLSPLDAYVCLLDGECSCCEERWQGATDTRVRHCPERYQYGAADLREAFTIGKMDDVIDESVPYIVRAGVVGHARQVRADEYAAIAAGGRTK